MSEMTLGQLRERTLIWIREVAINGSLSGVAEEDISNLFNAHLASQPAEQPRGEAGSVPPRWYTLQEIENCLRGMSYSETVIAELAPWFFRHIKAAFEKGFWMAEQHTQPKPEQAVGDGVNMQAIVDAMNAVGAEIDGGDMPDPSTGYAGCGASFTFDEKQIAAFVARVRAWGYHAQPTDDSDAEEEPFGGKKLPRIRIEHDGRRFELVIVLFKGRHFLQEIYQLVPYRHGLANRKVWPKHRVSDSVKSLMDMLDIERKGRINDYELVKTAPGVEKRR